MFPGGVEFENIVWKASAGFVMSCVQERVLFVQAVMDVWVWAPGTNTVCMCVTGVWLVGVALRASRFGVCLCVGVI